MCFSRDSDNTQATGAQLYLDPARLLRDLRGDGGSRGQAAGRSPHRFREHRHAQQLALRVAKAFLEAGFHVVCDKPLTFTLEEAEELARTVEQTGFVFALTHNYTGHPLVRHARRLFRSGEMGIVRKVIVEYLQDLLVGPARETGTRSRPLWRVNPAESGIGGAIGDIGTHAFNLPNTSPAIA